MKAHAIFSELLNKGYYHAQTWLDAFDPFYTTLVGVGIKADNAWGSKVLGFTKALFVQHQRRRSLMPEPTPGAMMCGMMRGSTYMDELCEKGIVRHHDVSNTMVMASMEKEGSVVQEALEKLEAKTKEITKHGNTLDKLQAEWRKFKNENSGLFS